MNTDECSASQHAGRVALSPVTTRRSLARSRWAATADSAFCSPCSGQSFYGILDLAFGVEPGDEFYESHLLETGWGLTFTFLVAAPFFALAARPGRFAPVVMQQVAVTAVAIATAAVLSASLRHLLVALSLGGCVAVIAALTGELDTLLRWPGGWSWLPGGLALAAAPLWLLYAGTSAAGHREGRRPIDVTWALDHWPIQAALALAIVMVSVLAAGYPDGWRLPAWCVCVVAVWIGADSWAYPDLAASLGRAGGAAAAAWGAAFLVAMHIAARDRQSRRLSNMS